MTASLKQPWLTIIGIGEGGVAELAPQARLMLDQAMLIVGGERHLNFVERYRAEKLRWPSPIADALPIILQRRGEPVVVLASGDPFHYGVGALLAEHIASDEIVCFASPSAFSLAASALKWSLQDCALISLHGRAFEKIIPLLQPDARILALSWDETTPQKLAALLVDRGLGRSEFHVLENLGGERERRRFSQAQDFHLKDISPLNIIALHVVSDTGAEFIPRTPGLPDQWFQNDGQITKREIRAVTLSALAPKQGELLWDIGAGSGSISIEWLLQHPNNQAIAIEKNPARAAQIKLNASKMGAPHLEIIISEANLCLQELRQPNAIFIGGGASEALIRNCWGALPIGGRLVINAVTLETQSLLAQNYQQLGGDLIQIQISRAKPVGSFHGLEPSMAIHQWAATKTS
jgi:precorrin-6B C5,15-methyltransferase / cobalt-precorrin-6B C5,C15-methyltransferase